MSEFWQCVVDISSITWCTPVLAKVCVGCCKLLISLLPNCHDQLIIGSLANAIDKSLNWDNWLL